jgi:epsilon-lactone hydrolase
MSPWRSARASPHVYPLMLGTPEAAEATDEIGKFLRTRVG